jgi:hypothetical protein
MSEENCQVQSVSKIGEGLVNLTLTFKQKMRILLSRMVPSKPKRQIKAFVNRYYQAKETRAGGAECKEVVPVVAPSFQAGELVRVRTAEEIEATLDHWRQLKGCGFMSGMRKYYGTTQIVLKPVKRFIDERENRVVRSGNLYLLDGLMCQGIGSSGRCDRSCHFFWRAEWLAKLDHGENV